MDYKKSSLKARRQDAMEYWFAKRLGIPFDDAMIEVMNALTREGFGVLSVIDIRATLKKKLDVDFQDYVILGACHPPSAYRALQAEDKIGLMLPCNVIVQAMPDGGVEVAAVDPVASMKAVDNPELREIAEQVRDKLKAVVDGL